MLRAQTVARAMTEAHTHTRCVLSSSLNLALSRVESYPLKIEVLSVDSGAQRAYIRNLNLLPRRRRSPLPAAVYAWEWVAQWIN